ncbi:copper chaperone [Vigna unguiculata]|uniref:Copper chaperone n=1 Tax=Vigna unguiculata TaxID=3917 RepID=A0A4D6KRG4_VIGUN|nr:copper chaperone [Vigna unguiculata]
MSKQDLLKIQTCVLKVNIDCDGCAQKVKKTLQKIDGVYSVKVDAGEGRVVVAGDVDPEKLVKKIKMGGKHAEIYGGQDMNHHINPKFQNFHVDNSKVGRDTKSQNQKGQKGGDGGQIGQIGQIAHFPNMKGVQDLKVPVKEQKSVRFNLPEEEFDASDDGFDEYENSFDEYDDEEEEEEEVIAHGHGHGHGNGNSVHHKKMMPKMGDGGGPHGPGGVMNGPAINNGHKDNAGGSRNNNGSNKKGGVIDEAMVMKGKGAKVDDGEGKKSSQKGKKKKKDGGLLGRFLGLGRKSKKVGLEEVTYSSNSKKQDNGSGNKKEKEGKMKDHSNGKKDFDSLDYDKTPLLHKNGKVGPSQKGYDAMEQHQGMQMQHVPYNNLQQQQQQQQYMMGMMMNQPQHQHQHHQHQHHYQHEANMNNMYPTNMMYGRPHPYMNYMAPPPMPSHPMADPITHTFSDENVESCRII